MPSQVKWILGSVVGIIVLSIFLGSFTIVKAGQRGVKTRLGVVVGVLDPGLHFLTPFIDGVTRMDVQTQKEQTEADAASSDLQTVKATVAVNYNLVYDKVGDLYQRIGKNYGPKMIDPAIQEVVKAVTAKYTAEQLITKRAQVTDEIQTQLSTKLALSDIEVTSVSIVNFDFSASFNQAIEAKVTAEQNALASKNKLDQVKYEAEQRIAEAKGEAEAIKIQAAAIQTQGGAAYVSLKTIEKWNGNLPTYMMGNTVPFLNIAQ
jgi:regulator of protease activity HflC (stomatin/prohibitin superfamily)